MSRICHNTQCNKELTISESLVCSRCKYVTYCSRECQKVDWKRNHKQFCYAKDDMNFYQMMKLKGFGCIHEKEYHNVAEDYMNDKCNKTTKEIEQYCKDELQTCYCCNTEDLKIRYCVDGIVEWFTVWANLFCDDCSGDDFRLSKCVRISPLSYHETSNKKVMIIDDWKGTPGKQQFLVLDPNNTLMSVPKRRIVVRSFETAMEEKFRVTPRIYTIYNGPQHKDSTLIYDEVKDCWRK